MKNPKEQYRNALRFQIKKNGTDVKSLAEKVGCTPRHIQGFLSEKEKKGMGANLGQAIAEYYQMSYSEMLDLGMWILSGKDPEEFKAQRISASRIGKTIPPTQGLKRGRGPSNRKPMEKEPSKSQLIAMAIDVLDSMTVHAEALASNIQIFYNALKDEAEMADMCDKILTMQDNINQLNELLPKKDKLGLDPS
jgi:hypothetical protein